MGGKNYKKTILNFVVKFNVFITFCRIFSLFVMLTMVLALLSGCGKNNDINEIKKDISDNSDTILSTTEMTTETTTIKNFEFLKGQKISFNEGDINQYKGFDFKDYIVTDINEIEYTEYNAKKDYKKIIYDDSRYMVYYYYNNEDNEFSGNKDIYVINKLKMADKPSLLVPYYFNIDHYYSGECVLRGNILWTKIISRDGHKALNEGHEFTSIGLYDTLRGHMEYEYWLFIDLTGNYGASVKDEFYLSDNRYYYCKDIYKDGEHFAIVGNTKFMESTKYKTTGGYVTVTNDGTLLVYNNDGIYSYFENVHSDYYLLDIKGSFLYVSNNAVYYHNTYGVLKKSNKGEEFVIKYIDFDTNTKLTKYIIEHSNDPRIKLEGDTKEQEFNLSEV